MVSSRRPVLVLLALLPVGCPQSSSEGDDEVGETTDSESGGESSESAESESSESGESESSESAESESESTDAESESSDTESGDTESSEAESSDTTDTSDTTDATDTTDTTDTDGFECEPVEPPTPPADCAAANIQLTPEFAPHYDCYDLGNLPGVPSNWGGLTVKIDDPYTLLIGGSANTTSGKLYAVEITRDASCHVTGWAGTPIEVFSDAQYNDGGVVYGPDDVLFLARWPVNELGQQEPGSVITDKVISLAPFSVISSPGGLNFVPPGFAGEGQLKLVSWSGGQWYSIGLAPDGMGTFDVVSATLETTIPGGPEGFVHIGAENPGFMVDGLLVSEYSAGKLAAYDADDNGDPVVDTRRDFVTGLTGAEGAFLDPYSGDFLFTTFGGGNRLIAIRGFMPNPQ